MWGGFVYLLSLFPSFRILSVGRVCVYLNFVGLQKGVPPPRQDHPVGGRQEGEPAVVEGGVDEVAAHGAEPRAVLPVEEVRLGRGRRSNLLRRESAENITLRQDCTESGLQRAKEIHPTIFIIV